jgi:hypothetical protein
VIDSTFVCFFGDLHIADIIHAIINIPAFNQANSYKLQLSNIRPSIAGCPTKT